MSAFVSTEGKEIFYRYGLHEYLKDFMLSNHPFLEI